MKKIVVPMLAMMLMITVVACGKNSGEGETLQSVIGEETAMETELTEVGVDVLDYDGHSFACFFGCSTWEEARDQCESMRGHLAVITSQEEDEALFAFTRYCGYDNVYIGYSDIEEEGNWQWVTGETSDYSHWNDGEPNGFTPNENYAVYGDNGAWYDGEFTPRIENGLISFICEWDRPIAGTTNVSYEELQTYIEDLTTEQAEVETVAETEAVDSFEMPQELLGWIESCTVDGVIDEYQLMHDYYYLTEGDIGYESRNAFYSAPYYEYISRVDGNPEFVLRDESNSSLYRRITGTGGGGLYRLNCGSGIIDVTGEDLSAVYYAMMNHDLSYFESYSDLPSNVASLIAQYTSPDYGYIDFDAMLQDMGFQLGQGGWWEQYNDGGMEINFGYWQSESDDLSPNYISYNFPNSIVITVYVGEFTRDDCEVYVRECDVVGEYDIYFLYHNYRASSQDIVALYNAITSGNLDGFEMAFTYP